MSSIKDLLDMDNIPQSVAVIMDGNGRWAKAKGLPRSAGHMEGVTALNRICAECARLGIKWLTFYTFSTENWNRPQPEVATLMHMVATELKDKIFMENDIRFRLIGDMSPLPDEARQRLEECMEVTAHNKRMTAVTALNYSSRWELTGTMRQLAREVREGRMNPEDITEEAISRRLQTNYMPDPDLLIRTGGELRISNYLLWQCAYTEFYFCDTYWPDFMEEDLYKAIYAYQQRQRRFGQTGEQVERKA